MARKPKPPLSDWLIEQRKARGESVEDIAKLLDRSPATIRGWEAGRPPASDDPSVMVLERHFGAVAPKATEPGDNAALAAALIRLADELQASREDRERTESRLRAVESELESLRGQRGGAGSPARSVPLGTKG